MTLLLCVNVFYIVTTEFIVVARWHVGSNSGLVVTTDSGVGVLPAHLAQSLARGFIELKPAIQK